jgi:hypothetical protein
MKLIELDNSHYEIIIGSVVNVPDGKWFKGAFATRAEVRRYKANGGDWSNYKGYLRQFMLEGAPIVVADDPI